MVLIMGSSAKHSLLFCLCTWNMLSFRMSGTLSLLGMREREMQSKKEREKDNKTISPENLKLSESMGIGDVPLMPGE